MLEKKILEKDRKLLLFLYLSDFCVMFKLMLNRKKNIFSVNPTDVFFF